MKHKSSVIVITVKVKLTYAHWNVWCNSLYFQTNVIEAGADMKRESEKEWYYGNKEKERLGPFSFEEVQTFFLLSILLCENNIGMSKC